MKRVTIIKTDNRDTSTTDLILDNDTIVEVNVQELFANVIDNIGNEELEKMFNELIKEIDNEKYY